MKRIYHWRDIGYTLAAEVDGERLVKFKLHRIRSVGDDGSVDWSAADDSGDHTDRLDNAEYDFRGVIRWDGCWHLNPDGYIHLSGGRDVDAMCTALARTHCAAMNMMGAKAMNGEREFATAVSVKLDLALGDPEP